MDKTNEDLLKGFLNIRADILIGKNLLIRYKELLDVIKTLNLMIDEADKAGDIKLADRLSGFCVAFYRLKDEALKEIGIQI